MPRAGHELSFNRTVYGDRMSKKLFEMFIGSGLICLAMSATLSVQAKQPDNSALQPLGGGKAMVNDVKVSCGEGLLPFAVEGKLEGVIDVQGGKVSFAGKHARLGYCGRPAAGAIPSLSDIESSVRNDAVSSITDLKGLHLKCTNDQLPLFLEGSAEGSLNTSKGIVKLRGDRNKVAVCLVSARST